MGRPEDEISTAAGCNRACEMAGVPHRVEDLDHRTAPKEIVEAFGPTLYAIAEAAANEVRPPRTAGNPTRDQLGYDPMSLDDGLRRLIPWLRDLRRL
jgi:nucleoside-diphosphate-sugar epimerase